MRVGYRKKVLIGSSSLGGKLKKAIHDIFHLEVEKRGFRFHPLSVAFSDRNCRIFPDPLGKRIKPAFP
jgi:hypothetical protein